MTLHNTKRPRLIATVAALTVFLIALSIPPARSVLMDGFIEFAQFIGRMGCFPALVYEPYPLLFVGQVRSDLPAVHVTVPSTAGGFL